MGLLISNMNMILIVKSNISLFLSFFFQFESVLTGLACKEKNTSLAVEYA